MLVERGTYLLNVDHSVNMYPYTICNIDASLNTEVHEGALAQCYVKDFFWIWKCLLPE
jgi:hypothetical protein